MQLLSDRQRAAVEWASRESLRDPRYRKFAHLAGYALGLARGTPWRQPGRKLWRYLEFAVHTLDVVQIVLRNLRRYPL